MCKSCPEDLFEEKKISALIQHLIKHESQDYYDVLLGWKDYPPFLTIRFEDLVGSKGGGNHENQITAIQRIAQHLDIKLTDNLKQQCITGAFGNTATFREGKIGNWKKYFKQKDKEVMKASRLGKLLIELGYESDHTW